MPLHQALLSTMEGTNNTASECFAFVACSANATYEQEGLNKGHKPYIMRLLYC